jgi:hypothetical protein
MSAGMGDSKEQRFELRVADAVWATLRVTPQRMLLEHNLNDVLVKMCPGFAIFDETGSELHLNNGAQLILSDRSGIRLKLNVDDDGALVDVTDPRHRARLAVELRGAGSGGDSLIQEGGWVLTLKQAD